MKAKFFQKTLDRDTRIEYSPSDEYVEVSEAFAKRMKDHPLHGVNFELEGSEPDEKDLIKEEYEKLLGVKPGKKSVETMKAEIQAFKDTQ